LGLTPPIGSFLGFRSRTSRPLTVGFLALADLVDLLGISFTSFIDRLFFFTDKIGKSFWPCTDVQPEIRREVTRKVVEIF
jgi:hypothetical protein